MNLPPVFDSLVTFLLASVTGGNIKLQLLTTMDNILGPTIDMPLTVVGADFNFNTY